ncbi:hypothetical protein ACVWXQ_004245 [Bradyrhizobium sp. S3.14.4]
MRALIELADENFRVKLIFAAATSRLRSSAADALSKPWSRAPSPLDIDGGGWFAFPAIPQRYQRGFIAAVCA